MKKLTAARNIGLLALALSTAHPRLAKAATSCQTYHNSTCASVACQVSGANGWCSYYDSTCGSYEEHDKRGTNC
jgi:hypothetical protein